MTLKSMAAAAGLLALTAPFALAEVSETRSFDPFTKVSAEGMHDIVIEVGPAQSVKIVAEKDKALARTKTRVQNGTLIIDTEDDSSFFGWLGNNSVTVYITMPALEGVSQDGMGDVTIRGVNSPELTLELNGMGDITASGACGHGDFSIDGMGDLEARNLKCKSVKVTLDGMGDAEVFASEDVDATSDGMGGIDIYGNPEKSRVNKDGMGSINFHDE